LNSMSPVRSLAAAALAAAAALLSGCLSGAVQDVQAFDSAPLFGMLYDERNEPCGGARISVDDVAGPVSDVNGRVVVPDLKRGSHQVSVAKPGYERLEVTFDFYDKSQVLYLKMLSLQELLRRLEDALAERRLADAAALVARAEAVAPAQADVGYLKAVLLLRSGRAADAAAALEVMISEGERWPALYLTLADVYQYSLRDKDKARWALSAYLERQDDAEVRARLEALR
jgi:hypothetical protein